MHTKVLIIGGGLSGLHTAAQLRKAGIDFVLVEARSRLGGRIESLQADVANDTLSESFFDMGPAWFWPGQRRMQSLVEELGLSEAVFNQYSLGDGVYQDQSGQVRTAPGLASMAGSYRLDGGLVRLINALEAELPTNAILKNAPVTAIKYSQRELRTSITIGGNQQEVNSDFVVLAIPPRLASANIQFTPDIDSAKAELLQNTATWMAGHAKFVAVYKEPFWRTEGLSGDAISHLGPLQEIHDASPANGGPYALFGFVGVQPQQRQGAEENLKKMAIKQLGDLFGPQALHPQAVLLKDWAMDENTATLSDLKLATFHAFNEIGDIAETTFDKRLLWSGTETAKLRENNGYLEGALEASERTAQFILDAIADRDGAGGKAALA